MANQRTTLRPANLSVPAGYLPYPVGDGTISAHTAGTGWWTRIGNSATEPAGFLAPYNRLTDKGIESKHATVNTDYRQTRINFHNTLANRLTAADGVTTNTSTTVTSATGRFNANDVGQKITGTNIPGGTLIAAINSTTSIELDTAATGTGSSIVFTIGDTANGTTTVNDYVAFLWPINKTGVYPYLRVGFSGYSLAAGAQIRGVRARIMLKGIRDSSSPIEGFFTRPNMFVRFSTQDGTKVFLTDANSSFTEVGKSNGALKVATSGGTPSTVYSPWGKVAYDFTMNPKKANVRAITAADINNLLVTMASPLNSNGAGNSEVRLYQMYLDIDWNAAPSSVAVVSNTRSQAPLLTWTYTDPENDVQDSFRVVVFIASECSGSFDPNVATTWPTIRYDSGKVNGAIAQHQIAAGYLRSGVTYRAFVIVTDAGSSGRTNVMTNSGAGGTDQGIDFTPLGDPLLSPWINNTNPSFLAAFDATTGKIGPLYMHGRPNLLTVNDAAMENNGTAGIGAWATGGAAVNTGTPTFTTTVTTAQVFKGTASGKVTADAAAGTNTGFQSGVVPVAADLPYMATIKLAQGQATARRPFTVAIAWFSDAAGTSLISKTVATAEYIILATNTYTTNTAIGFAPRNAVSARVVVQITSANSEVYYFDCAGITPYTLNCLDDGSFTNAAPSTSVGVLWQSTAGASNAVNWVDDGPVASFYTNNGALILPTDASKAVELVVGNNANACNVATFANLASIGSKYIVSGWAKVTACASATGTIQVGFAMNSGGDVTANIANLPIGTWTRFSTILDLSAMTTAQSGTFTVRAQFAGSPATMTVRIDGLMVERQFLFLHGDMENGTNGTSIVSRQPSLGEANDWQGWAIGFSDVAYDNSTVHAGTMALKLTAAAAAEARAFQFVHVEGYSSITFAAWMKSNVAGAGSGFYVDWYDIGGVLLATTTIGTITGTNGSYAQSSLAVSVPSGAHYCRTRFESLTDGVNTSTVWVDDVTVTPTGAVSMASGAYLDGGWSAGGSVQSGAALIGERATSQAGPWLTVRQFQYSIMDSEAVALTAAINFELTLNDYEWTPTRPDLAGNNYYRARMAIAVAGSTTPLSSPNSLNLNLSGVQVTTEWWLIDPRMLADNIKLGVKSIKIDTPEAMSEFMPLGRDRKVIVGDVVYGDELTVELLTVLPADHLLLQTQLDKQTTLYLQSPDGEAWFVRPTKRSRSRTWQGSYVKKVLRSYTLTLVEVDRTA